MEAENIKKDLILHQFGRAKVVPNVSPFCLKLETFLRLAKIPYENDFKNPQGPYGKAPWMNYKGKVVTDSTLCIEYLIENLHLNVDDDLSSEQKAIGRALVLMVEEHLIWPVALHRWVWDETNAIGRVSNWPSFPPFTIIRWYVGRMINKRAAGQGIGQHPKETIMEFAKKDLKALSEFLGPKTYFFGVDPTSYDCALFGGLAQLMWALPESDFEKWINGEFSNLKRFCQQMKSTFWPDWDECLSK